MVTPRKPLVALDVDGVLAAWLPAALDAIFEVTGKRYQHQEITQVNCWLQLKLQPEQCQQLFAIMATPGWCESLEVLPDADKHYNQLAEIADIIVVTSPWLDSPTWPYERMKWLSRHFGIGPEKLIHTSAKEYVSADIFIDDHPKNVRRWLERNTGLGLLYSASYNQSAQDLLRVYGWNDMIKWVENWIACQP